MNRYRRIDQAYTDLRNRHARTASNITRRNSRSAYRRVYGDERLLAEYLTPHRLRWYDDTVEACLPLRPRRVVDVGCGTGDLLHRLADRTDLEYVVGIDYASSGLDRARRLLPDARFIEADICRFRLPETFDLVLCTEVLEHLSKPAQAMETLVRLCSRAGTIVVTVPDGAQDAWEGHVNFWDADAFRTFSPVTGTPPSR